MQSISAVTDLFREQGLKVTPQRLRIFETLYGNQGHPTAESVYAEVSRDMPTISLRTVYQTLHDLAEMGEINELQCGTGSLRFDPNTERHHHLVCNSCGTVIDVYADTTSLRNPDEMSGFRVESTEVVFRGFCATCDRSNEQTTNPKD